MYENRWAEGGGGLPDSFHAHPPKLHLTHANCEELNKVKNFNNWHISWIIVPSMGMIMTL